MNLPRLTVAAGDIATQQVDTLVVNLFEGVTAPGGATGAVDAALGGAITQLIGDGELKGKAGEYTLIHTFGKLTARRVVVVGLGKAAGFDLDRARNVAAETARYLRGHATKRAATIVHGAGVGGLEPAAAAQALAEGTLMGLYRFDRHKTKRNDGSDDPGFTELLVIEHDAAKLPALQQGVETGRIIAEATNLCRDLSNEGSNEMTPKHLAEAARTVAAATGLAFRTYGRDEMQQMGFGALLAVAQGSAQEPQFITLYYQAAGAPAGKPAVALVGKGVTFDSGGISIKPADGMDAMKSDMSGGAAVIAAMQAIAVLKPAVSVWGLVPAAENMPSATAYKPGDIVRAANGKTIEVVNTDAEGRMLLADALSWARKEGLSPLIDVATLTGAASVALGPYYAGIMGNDQATIDGVLAAAKEAGENFWQLPLTDEYKDLVKSDIADVRQTGTGRAGGAISAAQVLHEFAEDTPWAHLDIAPTYRSSSDKGVLVKGSTGVAVRTMIRFVMRQGAE